jgi:hypothetical protein
MAEKATAHFFKEKRSLSQVKGELLPLFVKEWAMCCLAKETGAAKQVMFTDVFAGQGFADEPGTLAIAEILESLYADEDTESEWSHKLKIYLHDPAVPMLPKLKAKLEGEAFYEAIIHKPGFLHEEEGLQHYTDDQSKGFPALLYLDPFGYSFGQQQLLDAIAKPAADLCMLFAASRLGSSMPASLETSPLGRMFSPHLSSLESFYLAEKSSRKRERYFLSILEEVLQGQGYFTQIFKINLPQKDQASHYFIFASKERKLYFMAKEFMSQYSDTQADGVPRFSVNQASQAPVLPGFQKYIHAFGIDNLADELAGKRAQYHYLSLQEIFEDHSPGTPYIKANYKAAFARLRDQGRLNIVDAQNKRMKSVEDHSIIFYKLHGLAK